jgi:WD40 repeat protein
VAFSPDGSKLATGAGDGDVRLWNVRTGKMLFEKQGHKKQVSGLAFAPDGLSFASAGGNVRVWNASTGAEMLNLQPPGNDSLDLQGVAFSPNGKLLAAGRGKAIHIWDAATGTSRLVIPKVNSLFYFRIAFFDDKILLSNDKGGRVRFWDITTGKQVREFNAGEGLVLSPNGKLLASTHRDKIAVLDIKTGETIYEILDYYNRFGPTPNHLAISPDGKTLAAQTDHAVRVWDLATGKPRLDFRDSHTDRVHSAAFSPDGRQVLTGAGDGTARLWDAATAKQLRVFNLEKKDRAVVTAAAFSPDRKWIAAGGYDKSVGYCTVWDAATAKELRTQGFPYGVTRLAFSPDGQNLAVAAVTIYVWDFSTGKEPLTVTKRQKDIVELAFAPDGKTLTSVEQGSLHLWDVATKKQQAELALPEFGHAAISADGKKIVFSEGRPGDVLFVREIATGQNLRTIKVKDTFGSTVALSPDGRMLASCNANIMCMVEGYDYSIHLWEIVTGREVLQVQPGFTVRTLAFSADGQALISGLNNGTALIWNLKTVTPRMAKSASPQDLERLWAGLADDNAAKAHQALWTLVVTPKETVLFLQHLLKPVPLADQNIIRQWIADLDSDKFTIRQTAAKELEKIGDQVKAPIENAMKGKITLETRRRLEHILNNLPDVPGPGAVRNIRAIMALERIASSEAQGVLEALARGAPGARETEEAKGSLDRLKLRASRMP